VQYKQTKAGGGTRWRRFAAVMVPTVVVVGALGAAIANGAVPVSFAVSGSAFKVTASQLDGTNFVQYGSVAVEKGGTQQSSPSPASPVPTSPTCASRWPSRRRRCSWS